MSVHKPDTRKNSEGPGPLPEPSFQHLVETFGVPALIWTGYMKNPADEEAEPNLDLARYQIGMLEVLEQKTKGNLDKAEEDYLEGWLHNVRMAFVRATEEQGKSQAAEPEAKEEPAEKAPEAGADESQSKDDDDERPSLRETQKYDL